MKKLDCYEIKVDENHNVMLVLRDGIYDCYVEQKMPCYPYKFMFGLPIAQFDGETSLEEACDIAVNEAPSYYYMFHD